MEKLRGVEMVVRAADAGSFSRAARTLGVTPSAVSHAVAGLEKELRISIFYRTTRQLRLTDEGQAIYARGRDILDRLDELETAVARPSERLRGMLRVGLSVSLSRTIMMPAVAQFTRHHPELQLDIHLMTHPKQMHAEGVDVMLRVGDPPESGLIARRIARTRFGVYGSPEYFDRAGVPQAPEDLLRHSCLVYRYPGMEKMLDEWLFERGRERKLVKIKH
jgi:DNA-binding transcriptional LysR family regulator